jgi:hypothetical protein
VRATAQRSLTVNVLADTGRSMTMAARAPEVRVSVARITPARAGVLDPPLPSAPPAPPPAAESQVAAAALLPPILRRPATLTPPRGLAHPASVELEVRVDALGRVVDVRWAGGDADTAIVGAARRCASAMEFYPALLAGRPVEVWCRQRFELTPRR